MRCVFVVLMIDEPSQSCDARIEVSSASNTSFIHTLSAFMRNMI